MLIDTLKSLFERDLNKLKIEIGSFEHEDKIWHFEKGIANSAGNLCLHLIGNLNNYIGKELGKTDYVRQRDLEFSLKNIPKRDLIKKIDETILVVGATLNNLTEDQLKAAFPIIVFNQETTSTEYMLVHLATHLSYHVGQINYHRRLLDA